MNYDHLADDTIHIAALATHIPEGFPDMTDIETDASPLHLENRAAVRAPGWAPGLAARVGTAWSYAEALGVKDPAAHVAAMLENDQPIVEAVYLGGAIMGRFVNVKDPIVTLFDGDVVEIAGALFSVVIVDAGPRPTKMNPIEFVPVDAGSLPPGGRQ